MPHKKPIASETDARKMKSYVRLGGLKEAPASIGGEYFTLLCSCLRTDGADGSRHTGIASRKKKKFYPTKKKKCRRCREKIKNSAAVGGLGAAAGCSRCRIGAGMNAVFCCITLYYAVILCNTADFFGFFIYFSCVLHEITTCYKRVTRKFLQNRQATGTDRPQQTAGGQKRHF